jgi:hypothetical protein
MCWIIDEIESCSVLKDSSRNQDPHSGLCGYERNAVQAVCNSLKRGAKLETALVTLWRDEGDARDEREDAFEHASHPAAFRGVDC